MAIRTLTLVLTLSCYAAAQAPEVDLVFLNAYYLEHREKKHKEAHSLYNEYLQKAPRGTYAAQAEQGLQRLKSTIQSVNAGIDAQSVKIPRDVRVFGERRLARILDMEAAAKAQGHFLQAARLYSRWGYLSVVRAAAAGITSDNQELAQLVSQRNTHLAFNNDERVRAVTKQIETLLAQRNFRTLYSSVRAAMMARERAREKADRAEPSGSFSVFLYDLGQGADPIWMEQLARFRAWLGDAAAAPGTDPAEVAAARAVSIDAGEAIALIDAGKLKKARVIIDKIWNWSVIQ